MKTNRLFSSVVMGLLAISVANAQDASPAESSQAPAATITKEQLSSLKENVVDGRFRDRIFYHWKDHKTKGILKVFVHDDKYAKLSQPDTLNYDVVFRDTDDKIVYQKNFTAACVKCFGEPVLDVVVSTEPKIEVTDWEPKKVDYSKLSSMMMKDVPAHSLQNLSAYTYNEIFDYFKWNVNDQIIRLVVRGDLEWKNENDKANMYSLRPFAVISRNAKDQVVFVDGYNAKRKGKEMVDVIAPKSVHEIPITDWSEEEWKKNDPGYEWKAFYVPQKLKADIAKQAWTGPSIEKGLRSTVKDFKVQKLIVTSPTWEYKKNFLGVIEYRYVHFDIVYQVVNPKLKKTYYYYLADFCAKQAYNGKSYDKTFTMAVVSVATPAIIPDWK